MGRRVSHGPPTVTPWGSLNSRLQAPGALQITIFQELDREPWASSPPRSLVGMSVSLDDRGVNESRPGVALLAAIALLVALLSACGDGGPTRYEVTSSVIKGPTGQDVLVFAPDADGSWPVVFALHGVNGRAENLAGLGTALAREGLVVFAPTYRTDLSTEAGLVQLVADAECGYRMARDVAGDYGGDLGQPLTFVGWSLGATFALQGGLDTEVDPTGQYLDCGPEVPRADAVVAISGCHYEYQDRPWTFLDPAEWTNKEARVVVVAGGKDPVCMPWQSERAVDQLRSSGFDPRLIIIEGADHAAPIHPDDAGEQTVRAILDVIAEARGPS